jgi:hypothetical protein
MNAATIRQAKFVVQAQPKSADKSTKIGLTLSQVQIILLEPNYGY